MELKQLIEESKNIILENKEKQKDYLFSFNIFDICDIGYDEVKVCRFLYELLNPKGRHLQGTKYLKIFIETVLKLSDKPSDLELNNAIVKREEKISNNRRIDISISFKIGDKKIYIPIEVKIFAMDQELQCADYFEYSKLQNDDEKNSSVYYLTPDGKLPSEYSANGLEKIIENGKVVDYKGIIRISFAYDINNFLEKCLKKEYFETKYIDEHQVIKQFKIIVEKIGGLDVNSDNKKVSDLIVKDRETFESAKCIVDNFQIALKSICKQFFDLTYKLLKDSGWNTNYIGFDDFNLKGASIYKTLEKYNAEVCMEIWGDKLYYGICPINNCNIDDLKKVLTNAKLEKTNSNWVYWSYFDDDINPNFAQLNSQFYDLFDSEKMNYMTLKIANCLKEYYNKCL